jgi:hypothetical protein
MEESKFGLLLRHVKAGLTIQNACKSLEINRSVLYRVMTDKQRQELKQVKKLHHVLSQERNTANRFYQLGIESNEY